MAVNQFDNYDRKKKNPVIFVLHDLIVHWHYLMQIGQTTTMTTSFYVMVIVMVIPPRMPRHPAATFFSYPPIHSIDRDYHHWVIVQDCYLTSSFDYHRVDWKETYRNN